MSTKGIGRLIQIGIAKEATRGTAQSSATYWVPFSDAAPESKIENVTDDSVYGIIEDSVSQTRVKNWMEGDIAAPVRDTHFGLILLSLLGAQTVATHSGESIVYDHKFTVGESAQHQSLTLFKHDPLSGQDYSYALTVVNKLEIDYVLKKFINYKATIAGQAGVQQSNFTPANTTENYFVPQYLTFKIAPTFTGLTGGLTATGTGTSTIHITALSINTNLLQIGMTVTGTNVPLGATIVKIVSSTAFDLSSATTGAPGTLTFGPAVIQMKSAKVTINENVEHQEVLGNLSPADFLNKQFSVEGTLEAIWENESDFFTQYIANTYQAISLDAVNTDVVLGSATHPELRIQLARAYLTELTKPIKINDLVYQQLKFKAVYSLTDTEMLDILLTNLTSGTY
jgi:hypothetical protein